VNYFCSYSKPDLVAVRNFFILRCFAAEYLRNKFRIWKGKSLKDKAFKRVFVPFSQKL